MPNQKEETKLKALGLGTAGLALSARGAQYASAVNNNQIEINYRYKKGKGAGHAALANKYEELLTDLGHTNVKKINRDNAKASFLNRIFDGPKTTAKISMDPFAKKGLTPEIAHDVSSNFNPDSQKVHPFKTISQDIQYKPNELAEQFGQKGKKIVTLAAGESGSSLKDKIDLISTSLKNRPDAHLVVLAGNDKEIANLYKDNKNISFKGMMDPKDYHRILAKSDLHIGYTGASSINEQLASSNPSVIFSTLAKKSRQTTAGKNLEFAEKAGIKTFTRAELDDFGKTINDALDNPGSLRAAGKKTNFLKNQADSLNEFKGTLGEALKKGRKVKMGKAIGFLGLGGALLAGAAYNAKKAFQKTAETTFLENRSADWKNLKYLIKHKKDVYIAGREFGAPRLQLLAHDSSKFTPSLWGPYRDFWFGKEGITGSNSPEVLNNFRAAAASHFEREPHHAHKGPNGTELEKVPLNTRREMAADWYAVNKHVSGSTESPLEWAKRTKKISFIRDHMREEPKNLPGQK